MRRGEDVLPEIVPESHSSAAGIICAVLGFMLVAGLCAALAGPARDTPDAPMVSHSVNH